MTKTIQQQPFAIDPRNHSFALQYYRTLQTEYQYIDIIRTGVEDRLGVNKTIRSENLYINHKFSESPISAGQEDPNTENLIGFYDVIKKYQRLVILGDPGIGKTTLVSRLTTIFTDLSIQFPKTYNFPIPFPITLREFNFSKAQNFKDFLQKQYFESEQLKECKPDMDLIETALSSGQAFIIFDGIDEVVNPEQRKHLAEMILKLFEQYPDNKVWFTSRILGFDLGEFFFDNFSNKKDSELSLTLDIHDIGKKSKSFSYNLTKVKKLNIQQLYLAPFTDAQISQFAHFWAVQYHPQKSDQSKYAKEFVTSLERHPKIKAVARIPFLLTMMSLYFRINRRFPDGRVQLYKQIAKVYLDELRTRNLSQFKSELTLNEQMVGLSAIAYQMQKLRAEDEENSNIIISRQQAEDFFKAGLKAFGLCGNKANINELVQHYFDGLNKRSEILIPKSATQYAFIHLSYQEYFAAEYWYRRYQKIKSTSFKTEHKKEKQALFDEIFLASKKDSNVESIELFFECFKSDEASYIPEEIDYVFKEVFERYFEERDYLFEYSHDKTLFNIVSNAFVNEAISTNTLHQIKSLNIWGINQLNIEVLTKIKNLELLFLNDKIFSDLSPLKGLQNLQMLGFGSTQVSDLSPLKGLQNLQSLDFSETQVSDLSPLKGLQNLQSLYFRSTQASDLSPLKDLQNLQVLDFGSTQVSDLSPLKGLQNLKYIQCDKDVDVSPLKHLKNLTIKRI